MSMQFLSSMRCAGLKRIYREQKQTAGLVMSPFLFAATAQSEKLYMQRFSIMQPMLA